MSILSLSWSSSEVCYWTSENRIQLFLSTWQVTLKATCKTPIASKFWIPLLCLSGNPGKFDCDYQEWEFEAEIRFSHMHNQVTLHYMWCCKLWHHPPFHCHVLTAFGFVKGFSVLMLLVWGNSLITSLLKQAGEDIRASTKNNCDYSRDFIIWG